MKTILKPKSEWGAWREEAVVAQKRTFNRMGGDSYDPREGMSAPAIRPGADDHMKYPSRHGDTLLYRDGRKERMKS